MKLRIHPDANAEMILSARYYETQEEGLGENFLEAAERCMFNIREFPQASVVVSRGLRRALVPGFPFSLLYRLDLHEIFVVSVAHQHRKPEYWKNRLK